MAAVPGESANANPVWVTYITNGLLEVQVPVGPAKVALTKGATNGLLLYQPYGVNWSAFPAVMLFTFENDWFVFALGAVMFCRYPPPGACPKVLRIATSAIWVISA